MSLINQVLKDLESRRGQATDTTGLRPSAGDSVRRDWPRWFVALAVAVTLGVTLFVAEQLWRKHNEPTTVSAEPTADITTHPPAESVSMPGDEVSAGVEVEPVSMPDLEPVPEPEIEAVTVAPEAEPERSTTVEATSEPTVPGTTEREVAKPDPVVEVPLARPDPPVQERTLRTSSPRQRADEAYTTGVRALTEGRRAEAERAFRAALGHDSSYHPARLALANLLVMNGQTREAEAQLQQGLRIAPGEPSLADRYARMLLERGDIGGAIGVLSEAPPPVESEPEYHALLAALLQRAGHHEEAADTYAALVRLDAARSMWWVGLAISLEALDRGAAALDAYRRAIRDPRLSGEVAKFVNKRISALQGAVDGPEG